MAGRLLLTLALTASLVSQTVFPGQASGQGISEAAAGESAAAEAEAKATPGSLAGDSGTGGESGSDNESSANENGSTKETERAGEENQELLLDDVTPATAADLIPALTLDTAADDGTQIHIEAPEGAFPDGIQVSVKHVDAANILDALRTASADENLTEDRVAAYDFDFFLDDQHDIEPKKEISVQIVLPQMKDQEKASAYHLKDEDTVAEEKPVTVDPETGTVTLEAEEFSTYAILLGVTQNSNGIKIKYDDKTGIHSVTDSAGNRIILYCMNNELHWPHSTPSMPNVPLYQETTLEEFCRKSGIKDEDMTRLKTQVENLLYAGYPYNGYGLYEITNSTKTITADDFNQLLNAPQFLREDFPDSLGDRTFTYADRNDSAKIAQLKTFLIDVGKYLLGGTTPSGLTHQQLMQLPFVRAAECMVFVKGDPIDAYSEMYLADYAYASTSDAIWICMKDAGVNNNNLAMGRYALTKKLLEADTRNLIRTSEPVDGDISVTGDLTYAYSTTDHQWHTGRLTLFVPDTYHVSFALELPAGVTEESGKTEIKPGESFSLVTAKKPANQNGFTLTATVPWMDSNLKVYTPLAGETATDGKGYQSMIGAVIHKTTISKSVMLLEKSRESVSFTKIWDDADDQDGIRPTMEAYVTKLHLLATGSSGSVDVSETYKPVITRQGKDTWTVTYRELPESIEEAGGKVSYSVQEDSIEGYTASAKTVKNGEILTNTHVPETTSVTGKKTWNDNNDAARNRPSSITVNLLVNGEKKESQTVQADADGNWTYTFSNLPKNANGSPITYSVTEEVVDDYTGSYNGFDITNTYTPGHAAITVSKAWKDGNNQDGIRPASIQVQLYQDDVVYGDPVTLSEENNWIYTWGNLEEKRNGQKRRYAIKEITDVPGYTTEIEGMPRTGFTIVNTHTPETVTVSGTKTWNDENDRAGRRPGSITVELYADGVWIDGRIVKPDADGSWTYSFADLPKYADGKEINYAIKEIPVENYSTAINGYDVTNTYTPGSTHHSSGGSGGSGGSAYSTATTRVTVTKVWNDADNQYGIRPDSVQVQLYADGKPSGDPVTLYADGGWTYTWTGLAVRTRSGAKIAYTVQEISESKNYTAAVSGNAADGYILTNTYEQGAETVANDGTLTNTWEKGGAVGLQEDSNARRGNVSSRNRNGVPKTGDHAHVLLYSVLSISALALLMLYGYRRRRR